MKTTEQMQEWISELGDFTAVVLLLAVLVTAAQAFSAPSPQVMARDTVQLEGLVVTPTRVYSATQWALSRPLPAEVIAWTAPLRSGQQCEGPGSA